uniref:Uncharacterized protein n=1 Tax=Amphimedon queenslandica TaxID=400682 RepID=A0A1X7TEA2_AMPQE
MLNYVSFWNKKESDDLDTITVPSPVIMRSKCMEIHLEPTRKLFTTGNFEAKFTIQDGIDGILGLFENIYVQFIEQGLSVQRWPVHGLDHYVKLWFEKMISELFLLQSCSHRLASGLILACCLKSLKQTHFIDMKEEYKIKLIQVMTLSVTDGEKELDDLLSMIRQSEEKEVVIDGFNHHSKIIGELRSLDSIFTVLRSFPLLHFLRDLSKPNQPKHFPLDRVIWGSSSLLSLQILLETKTGFIKKHYDEIKELFQFDSKMLTLIPYICPQKETSLLCEILPIELAIVWLIERLGLQVSHAYSLRSHFISDNLKEHCFEKPMACIMKRIYQEDIKDFNFFRRCSEATVHLVQSFKKILNYSNVSRTLVELSVSLFIHIFYRVTIYDEEESDNRNTLYKNLREQVTVLLKDWVVLSEVIGGSFFGGKFKTSGHQSYLLKDNLELKFWENILALEFPCEEMKNELEKIVGDLVNDRVAGVPSSELKIDLFVSVEHRKGIPDFFRNIFLTKAIDALDDLFSKKQSIQRWDQLVELNSTRVVNLIAKILEKKYPDFINKAEVPFHDLLEWELWPGFLKVYNAQVGRKEGEWALIVTCAISNLDAVCANIHNGNITVTDLRAIKDKQTQMNKLCEASTNSQPAVLQESIAKRLKEFKHFEDYKGKLLHFLSQIGRKLIGQPELIAALQKDFQKERINTLCVTATSDGSCNVVCFPDSRPLDTYLDDFYIISFKYHNDLFNKYWKERLDAHSEPIPFSNVDSFRTCEEEIEWYKSVKETQGSVEVTSYGQMNNINEYGVYEIGSSKKGILVSRSEGIHLRLRESKHKRIPKLFYNLDELRDLESKLVLITGTETTERKQVDLFLD